MDVKINIGEARDALSSLVERAERGEDIVIARRGRPVVRLVPCKEARPQLKPGWGRSLSTDADRAALAAMTEEEWFAPDPETEAAMRAKGTG